MCNDNNNNDGNNNNESSCSLLLQAASGRPGKRVVDEMRSIALNWAPDLSFAFVSASHTRDRPSERAPRSWKNTAKLATALSRPIGSYRVTSIQVQYAFCLARSWAQQSKSISRWPAHQQVTSRLGAAHAPASSGSCFLLLLSVSCQACLPVHLGARVSTQGEHKCTLAAGRALRLSGERTQTPT